MTTDSLPAYYRAFHKEFGRKKDSPRLIQNVGIQGRTNNNRVERYHGELKERTKVQRGEQNEETTKTIMTGMKNYHNFVRPHSALDGKTPAEVAGIDLGLGERKWEELIRQSVKGRNGDKKNIKKISENRSLDPYF